MKISYTLLSYRCPRHIIKRLNEDPPDSFTSTETETGKDIHRLVQDYLTGQLTKLEDIQRQLPYGWQLVEQIKRQFEAAYLVEAERKVEYTIEDVEVKGYIDIYATMAEEIHLYDIKTSHAFQDKSKYTLQMEIYALPFLRDGHKVSPYIWLIRYGQMMLLGELTPGDIGRIERRILREAKRIKEVYEAGEEKLVPHPFECQYCEYRNSCPTWQIRGLDISELAQKYIVLREQLKDIELALKAYTAEAGAIEVNEYSIGYHPVERTQIDTAGALSALSKYPEAMKECLRIDARNYKKWCKKIEELANYVHAEIKPQFKVIKREE